MNQYSFQSLNIYTEKDIEIVSSKFSVVLFELHGFLIKQPEACTGVLCGGIPPKTAAPPEPTTT